MRGIDVSIHQGIIDWDKVKSSGIEFAIIRAGYGRNTLDELFVRNITEAIRVGLKVGVYWFSYAINESEAIKEANYCFEQVKPYKLSFPIFYDFEYDTERYARDNGVLFDKASRTSIIKTFCERIKQLGGKSGIYTNLDYIKYKLNYDELKAYPLWFAVYGADEEQTEHGEMMKQVSSTGKVAGIRGNVDLNVCYAKIELTPEEAKNNIQKKCGFEDKTMAYLSKYKFADDLFLKLWKAIEG